MTPLGMEPPTCRLVAQCLSQLRHRPLRKKHAVKKKGERNLKDGTKEKENNYHMESEKPRNTPLRCSPLSIDGSFIEGSR